MKFDFLLSYNENKTEFIKKPDFQITLEYQYAHKQQLCVEC